MSWTRPASVVALGSLIALSVGVALVVVKPLLGPWLSRLPLQLEWPVAALIGFALIVLAVFAAMGLRVLWIRRRAARSETDRHE